MKSLGVTKACLFNKGKLASLHFIISLQDFNDEFSDLDGVVQQRRQDMEGYSSSGSQTPESENSRGLGNIFVLTKI